jgi:hypothetical protein
MILNDPNTAQWMGNPDRICNPRSRLPIDIQDHAEAWFPSSGKWDNTKLCAGCPVQLDCLNHALAHPELEGIWGGTNEKGRKRLLAGRAVA